VGTSAPLPQDAAPWKILAVWVAVVVVCVGLLGSGLLPEALFFSLTD